MGPKCSPVLCWALLNTFFSFWYVGCLSLTFHLLPQNHTHASTDRFRHTSVVEWSIYTFNKFVFLCRLVDRFCTSVFTVISVCCRFSPFPTQHTHLCFPVVIGGFFITPMTHTGPNHLQTAKCGVTCRDRQTHTHTELALILTLWPCPANYSFIH